MKRPTLLFLVIFFTVWWALPTIVHAEERSVTVKEKEARVPLRRLMPNTTPSSSAATTTIPSEITDRYSRCKGSGGDIKNAIWI